MIEENGFGVDNLLLLRQINVRRFLNFLINLKINGERVVYSALSSYL
jgi:hypothetical protein